MADAVFVKSVRRNTISPLLQGDGGIAVHLMTCITALTLEVYDRSPPGGGSEISGWSAVQSNRRLDEGAATVEGPPLPWRIRHFRQIASLPPTPCFRTMSKLLELAGDVPELEFAAGDVIIEEGKPFHDLYLLKSGEVEILRDQLSIGKISKVGSALGEISALLGVPPTATAIALTPCRFAVVKDAAAFVTGNHEATVEIARNLATRLSWMTRTYVEQIYDDI